jgi:hypothetical protein
MIPIRHQGPDGGLLGLDALLCRLQARLRLGQAPLGDLIVVRYELWVCLYNLLVLVFKSCVCRAAHPISGMSFLVDQALLRYVNRQIFHILLICFLELAASEFPMFQCRLKQWMRMGNSEQRYVHVVLYFRMF